MRATVLLRTRFLPCDIHGYSDRSLNHHTPFGWCTVRLVYFSVRCLRLATRVSENNNHEHLKYLQDKDQLPKSAFLVGVLSWLLQRVTDP